jgi:VWFA-related protein
VTNKEGHHATGLTQADFKIFEDGVEQKIAAFSVESTGRPSAGSSAASTVETESAVVPAKPKPAAARRTYLICIDTLHASFSNFANVHEALVNLLRQEQPGDSQYAVMAMGTSSEVVRDVTPDPAAVLLAIENANFPKLFQGSQKGGTQADLNDFRRTLDDVRAKCDSSTTQPECDTQKRFLVGGARQIAARERGLTTEFFRQFHTVVEQFSHATGRRMIVLISDGFHVAPGGEAYGLLSAYFPDIHEAAIHATERMQEQLEPILRLAAKSNIAIYTIDARGLYTAGFFDASSRGTTGRINGRQMPAVESALRHIASEQGDTLGEIASATGGTAFHNRNDLLRGLQRAFADGRDYYMLMFRPTGVWTTNSAPSPFKSETANWW